MESATRLNLGVDDRDADDDDDHDDDDDGDDDDDEGGGEGVRVKSQIFDREAKPQTRLRETRGAIDKDIENIDNDIGNLSLSAGE